MPSSCMTDIPASLTKSAFPRRRAASTSGAGRRRRPAKANKARRARLSCCCTTRWARWRCGAISRSNWPRPRAAMCWPMTGWVWPVRSLSGHAGAGLCGREAETVFPAVHQGLGLEDFIVLGHSVGGGMAAMVAARYGAQCKAVITESAQPLWKIAPCRAFARPNRISPGRPAGAPGEIPRRQGGLGAVCLGRYLAVPAFCRLPAGRGAGARALPGAGHPWRARRVRLPGPPRAHPRRASGPVEVEIVAGGGHVPHREQPERIAQRIARFLARV